METNPNQNTTFITCQEPAVDQNATEEDAVNVYPASDTGSFQERISVATLKNMNDLVEKRIQFGRDLQRNKIKAILQERRRINHRHNLRNEIRSFRMRM